MEKIMENANAKMAIIIIITYANNALYIGI